MLDVVEAMSAHFHEHHEAIMRWSWKLFCVKWVRLIQAMERQRERDHADEVEAQFQQLNDAHFQMHGSSGGGE